VGFIMALFAIESVSYFRTAVCFLIAFFTISVIGSWEFLPYDIINIYSFRLSAIVFGDIVVLFLSLVGLRLVFNRVTVFFILLFLFLFLLTVINFYCFLGKVGEGDSLLVSFIDFVLNF
jgi:hypothetical protein